MLLLVSPYAGIKIFKEKKLKQTQLGSSSQSGSNRGSTAELDAIREQQLNR